MATWVTSTATGQLGDQVNCNWSHSILGCFATGAEFITAINGQDGSLFAQLKNSVIGERMLFTYGGTPPAGTITSVDIQVRWKRTGTGAGKMKMVSNLSASQTVHDSDAGPPGASWTYKTFTGIARPGGGSWIFSDFASTTFGFESKGDRSATTKIYWDWMQLTVTYTEASDPPIADFSANTTTGTAPLEITFTDLSTETPTSWGWDFGDSNFSTAQNPVHNYVTAETVTVTMTATNDAGSDDETKASYITVNASTATVVATFTADPLTGAFPLLVNFYDGATGTPSIVTWTWDFGDGGTFGTSSASQSPSWVYQTAGTYTVVETVANTATSDSTDVATRTSYVVIVDGRPQPTLDGTPIAGERTLAVQFTGTADNPVTNWTWEFGDDTFAYVQNPTHNYSVAGSYTVTLSAANANGQLATSAVDFITVGWIAPVADFDLSLNQGPEPLLVDFLDASTGDIQTYSWVFGDGGTSSDTSPDYTYTSAGTYSAVLTVTGTAGVSTTTAAGITVVEVIAGGGNYDFSSEIQEQLMSNAGVLSPCDAFDEFGGVDNVVRAMYDRTSRFVMETGLLQKEATLGVAISTGTYNLPTDLIELRRVEVDGVPLRKVDAKLMDFYDQVWEAGAGDYVGYIHEPSTNPLELVLAPLATATTVKVWYVYTPVEFTAPATCTDPWDDFPIPRMFWWIIKYGTMADLLSNEGDLYDIERAKLCEQLYQEGVTLTKLMLDKGNR